MRNAEAFAPRSGDMRMRLQSALVSGIDIGTERDRINVMATAPALEFKNESDLVFTDISSEAWREYQFESGATVRIEHPVMLNVSESGGHRIFDGQGLSHYVPKGWIHLVWEPKPGEPNFVR